MVTRLIFTFALLLISSLPQDNSAFLKERGQPFKPFRIIGNIYYVGTNDLACYLITSPDGHILLDTAMVETVPIVKSNIESLGFKLSDIKVILGSHAHFDHNAGHAAMKQLTGATVYASREDAEVLESGGQKSFDQLGNYPPVKVDRLLKDGQIVKLGSNKLKAHLTPGHTKGNTAWTMAVQENGKTYDVVFAPSMSINPGVYLVDFPAWPGVTDAYWKSFETLKKLRCDVFLAPHAGFFNLEAKVEQMKIATSNPFIDPDGYRQFVTKYEAAFQAQLKKDRSRKLIR